MLKNKYIISTLITITVIIFGFITSYVIYKYNPVFVINSKMGIKLPSSAKVMNYEYYIEDDSFVAKILIKSQDVEHIRTMINKFFKVDNKENTYSEVTSKNNYELPIPKFENAYSWWDLDKNSIQTKYTGWIDKEWLLRRYSPKVWVFISKDSKGQYYLYISY